MGITLGTLKEATYEWVGLVGVILTSPFLLKEGVQFICDLSQPMRGELATPARTQANSQSGSG